MYLSIDPGLAGTGWAVWNKTGRLKKHGVLTPKASAVSKKAFLARELCNIAQVEKVVEAWIEYPAKFGGVKGNMVANRGDLVKLAELVGYIEAALNMLDITVEPIPVMKWKGQLPKDIVIKRILRILPDCKAKSHDWDAIGIGLYKLGRF